MPLIITGTQRAGTTATARLFQAEGHDLGSTLMDEVGGLENETVSSFYRHYLGDPTFPFDDFPNLTQGARTEFEFMFMSWPVIKFSYLCMNPAFVSIWHKFRPVGCGDRFLIMYRNTETVCQSKRRHIERFSHDSQLLGLPPYAMQYNFDASCVALNNLGYPITIMPFDRLIQDFSINQYLTNLGTDLRIKEETWEKIIDPGKVHC